MNESFSWATPMSTDNRKYYLTHRNVAQKVEGYFVVKKERYECHESDCMMGWDHFRAHMSYPTNYWQAHVMTTTADGRPFGVFLGDGIASHMTSKSSSEDFASLDGKIYKLGFTHLKEKDPKSYDIMLPKTLVTPETNELPNSRCSLDFMPIH